MENKIIWRNSYKTGNKTIDEQHEKLFELANLVADPANDPQKTHHNLLALKHYVKEHFDDEEKIMKQCDFEDYSEHAAEHADLLIQLDDIGADIITNELGVDEIMSRMQSWLFGHFFKKDMRLIEYLQNTSPPLATLD
ncbi:MAG: bacteriohemerythrin [Methylomonas sp.]|jgi:hemerythrin